MNIKRNITFQLESRKKNGVPIVENVPIRMRVVFGGKRIDFTTGYRIDVAKWEAKKERVKNGCTNKLKQSSAEINSDLAKYEQKIQEIFKRFEVAEIMPSLEQIKSAFSSTSSPNNNNEEQVKIDFWESFDRFVIESGRLNNWAYSTHQKFKTAKIHLHNFRKELTFETFDTQGLNDYVSYLRDKCDMRNSTLHKQLGFIKWFLRWAHRQGLHSNADYVMFKPKFKDAQKKVVFLTWEELTALNEFQIPDTKLYLERVRDLFLFQCYTGLRYSDLYNLRRSDIKENHIEVTTQKTADNLIIELNSHSRSILEKYKDVAFEGQKALPTISNQKCNNYLKELAQLAGIDEPVRQTYYKGSERIDEIIPKYALLGTHAGRRTFICNALSLGIPANVVMKWTGHSDYKAMKPYIDIADKIKASQMSKFDQF
ncbi:MAG: tyrosine-type recombinase/integrase [Rikenellaceae bacterium]